MYDRILVPLDGSPLAEAALTHGEVLAASLGSQIHLLQVVHLLSQLVGLAGPSDAGATIPPVNMEVLMETTEREAALAEAYLARIGEGLKAKGLTVSWEVRWGNAAAEIVQCTQDQGIGLIALSTHGRSGLGRLLFGSVAQRVVRDVGVPVLLIRPDEQGGAG